MDDEETIYSWHNQTVAAGSHVPMLGDSVALVPGPATHTGGWKPLRTLTLTRILIGGEIFASAGIPPQDEWEVWVRKNGGTAIYNTSILLHQGNGYALAQDLHDEVITPSDFIIVLTEHHPGTRGRIRKVFLKLLGRYN